MPVNFHFAGKILEKINSFRIDKDKVIVNTAILIVLGSFLFMESGCAYYRKTRLVNHQPELLMQSMVDKTYPERKYPRNEYSTGELDSLFCMEHEIYAIWGVNRWRLTDPRIQNDTIIAGFLPAPFPADNLKNYPENRRSKRYERNTETAITKRVNLYVNNMLFTQDNLALIKFNNISEYEIYKRNPGKTAGVTFLSVFGLAGATFAIFSIILILTSCPFIYVQDGDSWQFAGEIYGGAVYPSLERDDYLALPVPADSLTCKYNIKIANMLQEIQFINQASIIVVQHDSSVKALIDKYGQIKTLSDPIPPSFAFDSRGKDCTGEVNRLDNWIHNFSEEPDTLSGQYLNSLDLSFTSGTRPDTAKLYIRSRNSLWVDHMTREFFNLFGRRYSTWVKKQENVPAGTHIQWMEEQGMVLNVYIKKQGQWEFADYFNMVGAMNNREMVLPLDLSDAYTPDSLSGKDKYRIEIRLESGYRFWELDYAAIDLSSESLINWIEIPADRAIDQNGKDVGTLLVTDDEDYLVQNSTGDEAILSFSLPENKNEASSYYLHSKGYYQQSDENNAKADKALLNTFREPGMFSLWAFKEYSKFEMASKY